MQERVGVRREFNVSSFRMSLGGAVGETKYKASLNLAVSLRAQEEIRIDVIGSSRGGSRGSAPSPRKGFWAYVDTYLAAVE
jgi:hypothetical protein